MILVTGATGFVGSRVAAIAGARGNQRLRLALHRRPPAELPPGPVETVEADLSDPGSLRGLCDGVRVVVHCASHVGTDPDVCDAVNARGTRALVEEAQRAGVARIVYLSTAAVYGDGVHRELAEGGAVCLPVSAASRSRLNAEWSVLRAAGTVLRPYLVYGTGDRWFVPAAVGLLSAMGGLVDRGRARLSLVDVDALAAVIVAAAAASPGSLTGVYHAGHPRPVQVRTLHAAVVRHLALPALSRHDLPYEHALRRVGSSRRHHLDMLAADHWFESSRIWARTGCPPGAGFARSFARHAPWYRGLLTSRAAESRFPRAPDSEVMNGAG
jgi:nucleoside-diphosphate-sugar epimerase